MLQHLRQWQALLPVYAQRPLNWCVLAAIVGVLGLIAIGNASRGAPHKWVQSTTNFPPGISHLQRVNLTTWPAFLASPAAARVRYLVLTNARDNPEQPQAMIGETTPIPPEVIAQLSRLPQLRRLDVVGCALSATDWSALAQCRRLHTLVLQQWASGMHDRPDFLSRLPVLPTLKCLDLHPWDGDALILGGLARQPQLAMLGLTLQPTVPYEVSTPQTFRSLQELTGLTDVLIDTRRWLIRSGEAGAVKFSQSPHATPLPAELIADLRELPHLRRVIVDSDNSQIDWLAEESRRVKGLLPRVRNVVPGRELRSVETHLEWWLACVLVGFAAVVSNVNLLGQFGHSMARTMPGYNRAHVSLSLALSLVCCAAAVFGVMLLQGGTWWGALALVSGLTFAVFGYFGLAARFLSPFFALQSIGFAMPVLQGTYLGLQQIPGFPERQAEILTGEDPLWSLGLAVAGIAAMLVSALGYCSLPVRYQEAGQSLPLLGVTDWKRPGSVVLNRQFGSTWARYWMPQIDQPLARLSAGPRSMWGELQRDGLVDANGVNSRGMKLLAILQIGILLLWGIVRYCSRVSVLDDTILMPSFVEKILAILAGPTMIFPLHFLAVAAFVSVGQRARDFGYQLVRHGSRRDRFWIEQLRVYCVGAIFTALVLVYWWAAFAVDEGDLLAWKQRWRVLFLAEVAACVFLVHTVLLLVPHRAGWLVGLSFLAILAAAFTPLACVLCDPAADTTFAVAWSFGLLVASAVGHFAARRMWDEAEWGALG